MTNNRSPQLIGWAIWAIAALFYGYEFIHRILPAAMIPELKLAFQVSDTALGTLTAIYFWAYALSQIPAGILIDRFGSRLLLTTACLLVTIGSFLLAYAPNINIAFFSRFLVGIGSAFAFVGCLKLGREWIHADSFPLVVGFTNLCAQVAAILGNQPLAKLVDDIGWQWTVLFISVIGSFITLALALMIRNKTDSVASETPSFKRFLSYLNKIVHHKQTWLIAIYGCLLVSPIVAFGEFWGIHYLQQKCHLSRPDAALLNSAIFMGIAIGGPLLGYFAKYYHDYLRIMRLCTIIALFCLSIIMFCNQLSYPMMMGFLLVYGMMSSNMLLCFTLINRQYESDHQATAIGFTNTIVMFGGAFFPVIIGFMLDYLTKASSNQYLVPQTVDDLEKALIILPTALVVALIMTIFIKPKNIK